MAFLQQNVYTLPVIRQYLQRNLNTEHAKRSSRQPNVQSQTTLLTANAFIGLTVNQQP